MAYPVLYPPAHYRPVRNSSAGFPLPGRGFIPHVPLSNASLFGYFDNAANEVSSHLWLSKDGLWEQYVPFDRKAWAQKAGNSLYISAEVAGSDDEDYTPVQVQRLGEFYAWGMRFFGWRAEITDTPGDYGIGTHRMGGASYGGHSCPGGIRARRRGDILAAALGRPSTPPPSEQEDDMPSPSQWTQADWDVFDKAVGAAVADKLTAQMRQLVTTDPDTGQQARMDKVNLGSLGEAIGLLVLRSSFGMRRDEQVRAEVAGIGDHLGSDGPLVAWTRDIAAGLTAVRAELARITSGSGGAVDLSSVHAAIDSLSAQLGRLTLTVTT